MANPNLQLLTDAAKLLKPILGELVFVGGCATALLITDSAAAEVRPTVEVFRSGPLARARLPLVRNLVVALSRNSFKTDGTTGSRQAVCRAQRDSRNVCGRRR
jgi:hypothetical protein